MCAHGNRSGFRAMRVAPPIVVLVLFFILGQLAIFVTFLLFHIFLLYLILFFTFPVCFLGDVKKTL